MASDAMLEIDDGKEATEVARICEAAIGYFHLVYDWPTDESACISVIGKLSAI